MARQRLSRGRCSWAGCASCSILAERQKCVNVSGTKDECPAVVLISRPHRGCPGIPPRFSALCLSRFHCNSTSLDSPGARERRGTILSCPPTLNAYQLIFSFIRTKVMTNDHGIQAHNEIYFLVPDIFPGPIAVANFLESFCCRPKNGRRIKTWQSSLENLRISQVTVIVHSPSSYIMRIADNNLWPKRDVKYDYLQIWDTCSFQRITKNCIVTYFTIIPYIYLPHTFCPRILCTVISESILEPRQ